MDFISSITSYNCQLSQLLVHINAKPTFTPPLHTVAIQNHKQIAIQKASQSPGTVAPKAEYPCRLSSSMRANPTKPRQCPPSSGSQVETPRIPKNPELTPRQNVHRPADCDGVLT